MVDFDHSLFELSKTSCPQLVKYWYVTSKRLTVSLDDLHGQFILKDLLEILQRLMHCPRHVRASWRINRGLNPQTKDFPEVSFETLQHQEKESNARKIKIDKQDYGAVGKDNFTSIQKHKSYWWMTLWFKGTFDHILLTVIVLILFMIVCLSIYLSIYLGGFVSISVCSHLSIYLSI